ncbi:BrnT family toxin [Candidatus Poribacteria bacterium]|nr:BrnT family toxin [Candidatus Poribacteria bacterium]
MNRRNDWDVFIEYLEKIDFEDIIAEEEDEFDVYPASPEILEKIEGKKHRLPFEEVREVFYNPELPPLISPTKQSRKRAIGESFSGRAIVVIFVWDRDRNIRVISARNTLSKGEATLLRRHKQKRRR